MFCGALNVRWTFGSADRSEAETKALQLDASIHCRLFDPGIIIMGGVNFMDFCIRYLLNPASKYDF